jgi:MerR family transcriptional regulator, light-induced transcriptional regulator
LDGWQVDYLGANIPQTELLNFLQASQPRILLVSVTMPFNLDVTLDLITAIKKQPEFANLKIMVGGLAFNMIPELWQITGADGYAPDAQKAVELAMDW